MNQSVLERVNARVPFACERRLALNDHECEGRITREHALMYAGRQIDESWAIVLLCSKAHNVDQFQDCGIMDKRINEWVAINRMYSNDENRYPRFDWTQRKRYLNSIFGPMKLSTKGL